MVKILAILVAILLNAETAPGQMHWRRLPSVPISGSLDASSDDHLMVFQTDRNFAISNDGGVSWEMRSYQLQPATSGKRISASKIVVFGNEVQDELHDIYHLLAPLSYDTGRTFGSLLSTETSTGGIYGIISKTTHNWFYGTLPYIGFSWYGAAKLKSGVGRISLDYKYPIISIDLADSIGMAVGPHRIAPDIIASTDSGRTWTFKATALVNPINYPVIRYGGDNTWFLSLDSLLLKSRDLGQNWDTVLITPGNILDMQFKDSIGILGMHNLDYLFVSDDWGISWQAVSMDNCITARQIIITSDTIAYAETNGGIVKTSDLRAAGMPVLSTSRSFSFGSVPPDTILTKTLRLMNVGKSNLMIASVSSSSDRFRVLSKPTDPIQPGDSGLLTFEYRPSVLGTDTAHLYIDCNTQTKLELVSLAAQVVSRLTVVEPTSFITELQCYPNPASSVLRVQNARNAQWVEIYDLNGVLRISASLAGRSEIDISKLTPGSYLLRVDGSRAEFVVRR